MRGSSSGISVVGDSFFGPLDQSSGIIFDAMAASEEILGVNVSSVGHLSETFVLRDVCSFLMFVELFDFTRCRSLVGNIFLGMIDCYLRNDERLHYLLFFKRKQQWLIFVCTRFFLCPPFYSVANKAAIESASRIRGAKLIGGTRIEPEDLPRRMLQFPSRCQ